MYATRITLGIDNFDLVSSMPYRSMRSNATRPMSEPQTLTISHEETKSGVRNSVVILEDVEVINTGTSVIKDSIKAQLKLSLKPYSGRVNNEDVARALFASLTAFVADPSNIDKLFNKES